MNLYQSAAIAHMVRKRIRLSALAGIGGLLASLIIMAVLGGTVIFLLSLLTSGFDMNMIWGALVIAVIFIAVYPFYGDLRSNYIEHELHESLADIDEQSWVSSRGWPGGGNPVEAGAFLFIFFAVQLFYIALRQIGNAVVLAATPAGRIESVIGALYRARFGIDLDCLAAACELTPDRTAALLRRLDAALLLVRADDEQPAVKLNAEWRDALAAAAGEAETDTASPAPFEES